MTTEETDIELTRAAMSIRTALLGVGLLMTLAACGGAAPSVPSTAPIQTLQASALPSPSPRALDVGQQGPLKSGTYVTASPFLARVTFSAPPGWYASMGGPYAVFLDPSLGTVSNDDGLVELVVFDKVYADPCHVERGLVAPPPGPSVDDLANALARLPGLAATTPSDVALGGYHGKQLSLTAPTSIAACSVWQLPLGASDTMVPGERDRYWILDVKGQRLVIDAHEVPSESAADKAAVQAILDSIRIAPAN